MILTRPSNERGSVKTDWLKSAHSFSFGHYFDKNHMGFASLRVINEDTIEPTSGFPTHPHKNMEIITYVTKGVLAHKDSLGNGSFIKPGEIQIMSAGSGITHSEYNPSDNEQTELLQIWIEANVENETPCYAQKTYLTTANCLTLMISPTGEGDSLKIKQQAYVYRCQLEKGQTVRHAPLLKQGWVMHLTPPYPPSFPLVKNGCGDLVMTLPLPPLLKVTISPILALS